MGVLRLGVLAAVEDRHRRAARHAAWVVHRREPRGPPRLVDPDVVGPARSGVAVCGAVCVDIEINPPKTKIDQVAMVMMRWEGE